MALSDRHAQLQRVVDIAYIFDSVIEPAIGSFFLSVRDICVFYEVFFPCRKKSIFKILNSYTGASYFRIIEDFMQNCEENDCLRVIQLLLKIPYAMGNLVISESIERLAKHNSVNVAAYYIKNFKLNCDCLDLQYEHSPLTACCRLGNIEMFRLFKESFSITQNQVLILCDDIFLRAVYCSQTRMLEYLLDTFDITAESHFQIIRECFNEALLCNLLDIAQILYHRYGNWVYTDSKEFFEILHGCVQNGHMKTLPWFLNTSNIHFPANRKQRHSLIHKSFAICCLRGHLEMAKYIHSRLNITITEMYKSGNNAFWRSCYHNQLNVAKWLTEEFKISTHTFEMDNYKNFKDILFKQKLYKNHMDIIIWLVNTFDIRNKHTREYLEAIGM